MNVGVCKLTFRLPGNQGLKGKRRVINSLSSRLRNKFNVSVAEVDDNESWQAMTLGVSCVSNSTRHADQILSQVVNYMQDTRDDIYLVDCERETLSGF